MPEKALGSTAAGLRWTHPTGRRCPGCGGRGSAPTPGRDLRRQREVGDAFFAAAREATSTASWACSIPTSLCGPTRVRGRCAGVRHSSR
jgi:hypothetical protein